MIFCIKIFHLQKKLFLIGYDGKFELESWP
jgi:hypothetical protein